MSSKEKGGASVEKVGDGSVSIGEPTSMMEGKEDETESDAPFPSPSQRSTGPESALSILPPNGRATW